jgi:hypothetical protein
LSACTCGFFRTTLVVRAQVRESLREMSNEMVVIARAIIQYHDTVVARFPATPAAGAVAAAAGDATPGGGRPVATSAEATPGTDARRSSRRAARVQDEDCRASEDAVVPSFALLAGAVFVITGPELLSDKDRCLDTIVREWLNG